MRLVSGFERDIQNRPVGAAQPVRGARQAQTAHLKEKIHAGLDRLYTFQHEDGGWGWWQSDESHAFMSAYVVAGLKQAESAGEEVKADAIAKGTGWLKNAILELALEQRCSISPKM